MKINYPSYTTPIAVKNVSFGYDEKELLYENQKHPFCNINVIPASDFSRTFRNEND